MSSRATLSILSVFAAACGASDPDAAAPRQAPATGAPPNAAAAPDPARARQELARLLEAYDALPAGPERDALARRIDQIAGQRYAAWSRLYWHRDLGAAMAEARERGVPILSLRMLGRLDEDLSCANSRFFRVALYANREVSGYLRDHFVLHWSTERPVPVARIDFGDGRVLERTVAGNSAHYVLDAAGRPVDVIPGLYSPALFLDALEAVRPAAIRSGALDQAGHAALVADLHRDLAALSRAGSVRIATGGRSLVDAEVRAMSKAMVEMPVVLTFELGTQLTLEQARAYEQASAVWHQIAAALGEKVGPARLDPNSRALFASLTPTDWARAGQPLPAAGVEELIDAFEQVMARDAAFNELVLHQQIHAHIAAGAPASLEELNRWVYAALFLTPAEDPWLGMATPGVFTALPRDGLALAAADRPAAR